MTVSGGRPPLPFVALLLLEERHEFANRINAVKADPEELTFLPFNDPCRRAKSGNCHDDVAVRLKVNRRVYANAPLGNVGDIRTKDKFM